MKLDKKHNKGFTLVELLVVIAIIAILAALSTPMILKQLKKAKITKSTGVCKAFEVAVDGFESEYNFLPYDPSSGSAPSVDTELTSLDGVITVLAGLEDEVNAKEIQYFTPGDATGEIDGMLVDGAKADLYDPWGKTYNMILDYDYDGKIDHPYDGAALPADVRVIRKKAIMWSLGPDGNEGNPSIRDNPSNFR